MESIKDDRPQYGSLQAILFGPYLLAGLTTGDWDIKTGNSSSISDWITAIPASYNNQLVSLTQESNSKTFVFSNSNGSLTMEEWPAKGTNSAVHATFRGFFRDPKCQRQRAVAGEKAAQSYVTLEPFDLPGMAVVHQGPSNGLAVSTAGGADSAFNVIQGLDGKQDTVSLESTSQQGCFVYSGGVDYSAGSKVRLVCPSDSVLDASFQRAASFTLATGMRQYNPISFVVKGVRQNFLLEPLLSLRDETYSVYFNIGA